ncbi:hypothetical protein P9G36_24025 [Bacillus cereus]|nr:hypothetical protein [Bacillus cereus]
MIAAERANMKKILVRTG